MLASAEPEAMKSTAAMVALKAIGDPSAFLELNSTSEYIDLYRDSTSLPLGNILHYSNHPKNIFGSYLLYCHLTLISYSSIWLNLPKLLKLDFYKSLRLH